MLSFIKIKGINQIFILEEILVLLDNLNGQNKINYNSFESKKNALQNYFESVKHKVSGIKKSVEINSLIFDLKQKANHNITQIKNNELLKTENELLFFNGHYDNSGTAFDGKKIDSVKMDLTSQVIPLICDIPDKSETKQIFNAVKQTLKDENIPGLRLCTKFDNIDLNIGIVTGFVYGNKEHGSKWMQQNIMFAYGLYQKGFTDEAYEVLSDVYKISADTQNSKIFPGIPSYFNNENKGAYAYLTGSSSWNLLTLVTKVFGVECCKGNLCIKPALKKQQFSSEGIAQINCFFQGKK